MPNRVIREELLRSDRWLDLAHPAERLAFAVLVLLACDLGTVEATDGALVRMWREPCNLKGRQDATKILAALVDADLVRPYTANGKRYLFIPRSRQRFRATTFLHPPPPEELLQDEQAILKNVKQIKARISQTTDICQQTAGICQQTADIRPTSAPVVVVEVEDVVVKGAKARSPRNLRFVPPTVEDVRGYATEQGLKVDPQAFIDFYESKGWVVGKSPMKDWRAAARNWGRKSQSPEADKPSWL